MRRKWQRKERNAQVGDYVAFLKEDNEIRGKWCVGRIVSTFPGADGIVRNVAVKTSESSYKRPVQKIASSIQLKALIKCGLSPVAWGNVSWTSMRRCGRKLMKTFIICSASSYFEDFKEDCWTM